MMNINRRVQSKYNLSKFKHIRLLFAISCYWMFAYRLYHWRRKLAEEWWSFMMIVHRIIVLLYSLIYWWLERTLQVMSHDIWNWASQLTWVRMPKPLLSHKGKGTKDTHSWHISNGRSPHNESHYTSWDPSNTTLRRASLTTLGKEL